MKHSSMILSLALLLAALSMTACSYAPGEAKTDPVSELDYPQVAALEDLRGKLKLSEAPVVSRSDAGPITVTAAVRLASDKERPAQYRFFFFDEAGQPLDSNPGWAPIVLPARAKVYVTGTSLEAEAVDWSLEVRPERHPE